jgi:ornithine carbamoyltransferase
MKHLLSIESMRTSLFEEIFGWATELKRSRGHHSAHPLRHQTWGMIFAKSSTRTRVSFEVGIRELGGDVVFMNPSDIQLGRGEPIADTARVMGRMLQGAIIRTFKQSDIENFAMFANIPTINALSDDEHPCQIIADIFTYQEKRGPIRGKTVAFIGDGACNVPLSWIFAAAKLGIRLRIASPEKYSPPSDVLARAQAIAAKENSDGTIEVSTSVQRVASDADLVYTDTLVSMGKETEAGQRMRDFEGYQVNDKVLGFARKNALVMHCLPAYVGKEISKETFDAHAETIFDQAENRLHVQKAILTLLAKAWEKNAATGSESLRK